MVFYFLVHSGSLIPYSFYFPTPEKVDSIHPAITKPFFLLLLAAVTFAIMSYNVTGIRGVPDVHRPGAKLAIISAIF